MKLPSQEYLQSRIDYDPTTGEARWKPVDSSYGSVWKQFNTRYAGKDISLAIRLDQKRYALSHLLYKLCYNIDVTRISYLNNDSSDLRLSNLVSSSDIDNKIKKSNIDPSHLVQNCTVITKTVGDHITYHHISGNFIWKPRDSRSWSARFANTKAGTVTGNGYVSIKINYKSHLAHRLAWFLYYGTDPVGYLIDHIDTNKANNCISNLRLATYSSNTQHSHYKAAGYRNTTRFIAKITINKSAIILGTYDTEAEARQAYEAALKKYKPVYKFTEPEQALLDELYATYPNADPKLQLVCHNLQVKALNYYIDAALVQNVK